MFFFGEVILCVFERLLTYDIAPVRSLLHDGFSGNFTAFEPMTSVNRESTTSQYMDHIGLEV